MIQVMPKWKVTVGFDIRPAMVFFVSDAHIENVLRMVSSMQFAESGLAFESAVRVYVERAA